jgi:hypothetical protein
VAVAADRHDPGGGRGQQRLHEEPGQGEVSEVIDAELRLEAVLGARIGRHHHAGVVEQQVDPRVRGRPGPADGYAG